MNFLENGQMEVTPGLLAAEARRKEIESNLKASRARLDKQRGIVQVASKTLDQLLVDRLWERSTSPDEIKKAKREYKAASENFEDEEKMLEAIQIAIKNTEREMASASGEVKNNIEAIISRVASESEQQLLANVEEALSDYIASQRAIRGPLAVLGAQYELEHMTSDIRRLKAIEERYGAAYRKLEEAVR